VFRLWKIPPSLLRKCKNERHIQHQLHPFFRKSQVKISADYLAVLMYLSRVSSRLYANYGRKIGYRPRSRIQVPFSIIYFIISSLMTSYVRCMGYLETDNRGGLGTSTAFQLTTGIGSLAETLCSLLEYQTLCPETDVRIHIILETVYN
jgi:hypothetical protein